MDPVRDQQGREAEEMERQMAGRRGLAGHRGGEKRGVNHALQDSVWGSGVYGGLIHPERRPKRRSVLLRKVVFYHSRVHFEQLAEVQAVFQEIIGYKDLKFRKD